jgi:hypothetical protein
MDVCFLKADTVARVFFTNLIVNGMNALLHSEWGGLPEISAAQYLYETQAFDSVFVKTCNEATSRQTKCDWWLSSGCALLSTRKIPKRLVTGGPEVLLRHSHKCCLQNVAGIFDNLDQIPIFVQKRRTSAWEFTAEVSKILPMSCRKNLVIETVSF